MNQWLNNYKPSITYVSDEYGGGSYGNGWRKITFKYTFPITIQHNLSGIISTHPYTLGMEAANPISINNVITGYMYYPTVNFMFVQSSVKMWTIFLGY